MSRMHRFDWQNRQARSRSKHKSRRDRCLRLEPLEDRRMLATFMVTNLSDGTVAAPGDLPGSLRQAIYDANNTAGTDLIEFTTGPGTIPLSAGQLTVSDGVYINILGADITIAAGGASRVFNIDDGTGSQIEVEIWDLTITGGADGVGGGILNNEELTLVLSTISGNTANFSGGGIINYGTLKINRSTISGNSANIGGGGIFNSGTLNIEYSTLSGNMAGGDGGGITNLTALTIENSTISGNSANRGGGVHNSSTATVTSGTFRDNSATTFGGGIYHSGPSLTLDNTILSENDIGGDFSGIGAKTLLGANIVQDSSIVDAGVLNVDAQLAPLADNGGPTLTHALLVSSPAINAGVNASSSKDQREDDFPRVALGGLDIGAFELQPISSLVVGTADDGVDDDYSPGDLSLREAILFANLIPGADTITFDTAGVFATPQTITLLGNELDITDSVTITGTGASRLTINAGGTTRVFNIDDGDSNTQLAVAISDLTITGGGSVVNGAGILSREQLTLTGSTISGNSASGRGGGIYLDYYSDSASVITSSTISGNSAASGGGIASLSYDLTVTNSTFSGNTATSNGGGIYGKNTTTVTHSTISGNSADKGGGIFFYDGGEITVSNSIVSGNSASTSGNEFGADILGLITLNDFNLIGDSSQTTAQALNNASAGVSDITATSDGTNSTALAAILNTTLANNGGPTFTHALVANSPAIDAGNPLFGGPPNEDQRGTGFSRVFNAVIDIGAYELQTLNLVVDTVVDESDGDYSDGDLSLREALELANANLGADTITFDTAGVFATPQTITLGGTELAITDDVTITGTGSSQLSIDANQASGVFNVDDGTSSEITVTISGLTITGGSATNGGGIINVEQLTVASSTLSGNSASDFGGGIHNTGTLTVTGSTLAGNSVGNFFGGGIFNRYGTLTVTGSTISGNSSPAAGGIYSGMGMLTVTGSTISDNSAPSGGGGIANGAFPGTHTATVTNSTLSRNSTTYDGGGIANVGTLTVAGSTLLGNSASRDGGGIWNSGGTLTVTSSLISGNSAIGTGNEIERDGGTVNLNDFNLIGDSSQTTAQALNGVSAGASDITATSDGSNPTALVSILDTALANNGGPTQTHALVASSPAINASSPRLVLGTSLVLDGTDDYVDLVAGESDFDAITTAITIEAWFKVDLFDTTWQTIVSKGDDSWRISRNEDTNTLHFAIGSDQINGSTNVNDGQWHHVAGVYDGANMTLYVDGVQDATAARVGVVPVNNHAAFIGENAQQTGRHFDGQIDDVRIWDTDRSLSEIMANMLTPLTGSESNLVAYYNFDDSTATDQTANGNDGTLVGGPTFEVVPSFDQRGAPFVRQSGTVDIGAYERQTLASPFFHVTTANDEFDYSNSDVSLREAINSANGSVGADTITFDAALSGETIDLTLGQLSISESVTITGLGADQLTVDAGGSSRVLQINSGTVNISGLTLSGGNADTGGGIQVEAAATTTLTGMVIHGNTSTTTNIIAGGGILNFGVLNVLDSTISNNTALNQEGGGILNWGGTLAITNSTISGNHAGDSGGGVRNYGVGGGSTTISNSTITGNTADNQGGGIYVISGSVTVSNSIVAGNTATNAGNEIHRSASGVANLNDYNLLGDSSQTMAQALSGVSAGANDITATSDGTNSTALAAILDTTLANNGGPTQTHALVVGSPAINAGDAGFTLPPDFDQRGTGFPRLQFGRVDIGGYEFDDATIPGGGLVVSTTSDVFDGDYTAGNLSLREASVLANVNPGANTITFDTAGVFATPQTITLGGTELAITDDVTITGTGANQLTVSANNASRVFNVDDGTASQIVVLINELTISGGGMVGEGGGIYNREQLTLNRSTVSGNTADDGGGIYSFAATLSVYGSTISGNTATTAGGVFNTGMLTVANSTVSGNSATSNGGGIYNYDPAAVATVISSTLWGNSSAPNKAGGIYNSGTLTLENSIVSGSGSSDDIVNYDTLNFSGENIVQDSSVTGTGVKNVDPLLAALADNGGPTQTHAIGFDSPALNAGVSSSETFDQRGSGFARVAGGIVDIGAFELQTLPALVVDTLVDESDEDYSADDLSLREALELANAFTGANTVTFDGGLSGTINLNSGLGQLVISDDVTVTGLGASTLAVDAGGSSRVLQITSGTVDINGLTISGGNADQGGGIKNELAATTTLTGLVVNGNTATSGDYSAGGGIWNQGDLTIAGSTISNNNTTVGFGSGAGIWNRGGLTVTGSTITGNSSVADGGGIYSTPGSDEVTIVDSTISNNYAADDAGGVFILSGSGNINTIIGSTISGNTAAGDDGGGIWSYRGILEIANSTISGNSAVDIGGGLHRYGSGSASVSHSTITGNSSEYGGGVYFADSTLTLGHTLITGNTATTANEIFNDVGSINLNDYNLIGDSSQTTAQALSGVTAGASDITATSDGTNSTALASILNTTLADNGGPTLTHALPANSPAINAGDPLFAGPPNDDQRGSGFARVVFNQIDVGAIERQNESADFNLDGLVSGFDFLLWQRGFGTTGTAVHSDGDANFSSNVDSFDLDVWKLQYGTVAPIVAAISKHSAVTNSPLEAQTSAPESAASADLLDAAMAWEMTGALPEEEPVLMLAEAIAEQSSAFSVEMNRSESSSHDSSGVSSAGTFDDEQEREVFWLTDEQLESVFG